MKATAILLLLAVSANAAPMVDPASVYHSAPPASWSDGAVHVSPVTVGFLLGKGWRLATEAEVAAQALVDQEAAEDAEAARIAGLAQAWGGIVAALRQYLVVVGWDIPCSSQAVTVDLIQRAVADTLTAEQVRAQNAIADLYMLLQGQGVSNADIADIWEAMQ